MIFLNTWEKISRTKRTVCTLVIHSIPTTAMMRSRKTVAQPMILTSFIPLSTIPGKSPAWTSLSMSSRDSQKPITYMATAIEFARVNISPIAPPNSGPSDLEQRSWEWDDVWHSPGDHVVDSSSWDLTIGAHCWHGERGEEGDNVGDGHEEETLDDAGLTDDPGESEEEHDSPDVEKTWHQHSLLPCQLGSRSCSSNFTCNNSICIGICLKKIYGAYQY